MCSIVAPDCREKILNNMKPLRKVERKNNKNVKEIKLKITVEKCNGQKRIKISDNKNERNYKLKWWQSVTWIWSEVGEGKDMYYLECS